jgi:hypothetical protein
MNVDQSGSDDKTFGVNYGGAVSLKIGSNGRNEAVADMDILMRV